MSVRLTHLRLANWRNFKAVDLELQERMFIVGPNASGKTNLLDAFRFLRDIAVPGGGLARAIQERRGIKHLRSLHAGNPSDLVVDMELEANGTRWRYKLEIEGAESKKRQLQVKHESVWRDGKPIGDARPDSDDKRDPALLTQTHLEQKSQNAKFRAIGEALTSIVHVHVVPQVTKSVMRTEEIARKEAPGSDFIEQIAQLSLGQQKRKLARIQRLLRSAVPRFSELKVERDKLGRPHLEARYEHWRREGGWQNEQEFSDGTLRLIGVLWAIEQGTGPLLIEEPELSLHADVTRQIPRLLTQAAQRTGRQFIVSTNSEDMLGDRGVDPSEIILLTPTERETRAELGTKHPEIVAAARAKISLGRVVRAKTRPPQIEQLILPGVS